MSTNKLRLSKTKIRQAKIYLRRLQKKHGYSLRELSAKLNGVISFQSLGRFIAEKDYVPASEKVCKALDLYITPNPYRVLPKHFNRTEEALSFYKRQGELIREAGKGTKQLLKEARG